MKSLRHLSLALAGIAAAALVLAAGSAIAQVTKGKARPVETKQLMKGIMKPHCTAIKDGLEKGVADDKAWEELGLHAALLNELSYSLMEDGRCPDGTWADAASKVLRQGSADILKAVQAKNATSAKAAFGSLTKSCKACHDAHKKE